MYNPPDIKVTKWEYVLLLFFLFSCYSRSGSFLRTLSRKMPLLPTMKTASSASGSASTAAAAASVVAAIPCQVPDFPAIIASTATAATAATGVFLTVPSHVPVATTIIAAPTATATATTGIVSSWTIPSHVPNLTTTETATAAAAATTASFVTIPSHMASITTIVTTSTTTVTPISASPTTGKSASAAAASGPVVALDGWSVRASDIDRLGPLVLAQLDIELDKLALSQATEAVGLDRGLMDEQIVASFIGGDEPEAFRVIEPPDHTSRPDLRHWIENPNPSNSIIRIVNRMWRDRRNLCMSALIYIYIYYPQNPNRQ